MTERGTLHSSRTGDVTALLVGEGIETVLSVLTAVPEAIAAAALSVASLGAFSPPRPSPQPTFPGAGPAADGASWLSNKPPLRRGGGRMNGLYRSR